MHKLILPFAATLITLVVAACATTDPDMSSQLEAQSDRLAQLEQQLNEISTSLDEMQSSASMEGEHAEKEEAEGEHKAPEASAFELAVAQYVMDTAGFHAIDDALTETGEIDPSYVSAVTRVARVVGSTQWPHDLSEGAAHLLEVLTDFQTALSADDAEAATPLAGMAHNYQHDLSAAITAWLSGEMSMHEDHETGEVDG